MGRERAGLKTGLICMLVIAAGILVAIKIYGPAPLASVNYIDAHDGHTVWALAISPDGEMLASGDADGKVILWSLPDMKRLAAIEVGGWVGQLAFSSDGSRLYAPNNEGAGVVEMSTSDYSKRIVHKPGWINVDFVSPIDDDRKFVTVVGSFTVEMSPVAEDTYTISGSGEVQSAGKAHALRTLSGSYQVLITNADEEFEWGDPPPVHKYIPGEFIKQATLSPDRRFLAISSYDATTEEPHQLTIVDLVGKAHTTYEFGSSDEFHGSCFAFAPDSQALLLYAATQPMREFKFNRQDGEWAVSALGSTPPGENRLVACVRPDGVMYVAGSSTITLPNMVGPVDYFDRKEMKFGRFASVSIGPPTGLSGSGVNALLWVRPSRLIAALHDGKLAVIDAVTPEAGSAAAPSTSKPTHTQSQ